MFKVYNNSSKISVTFVTKNNANNFLLILSTSSFYNIKIIQVRLRNVVKNSSLLAKFLNDEKLECKFTDFLSTLQNLIFIF